MVWICLYCMTCLWLLFVYRSIQGRYFKLTCNLAVNSEQLYKYFIKAWIRNIFTCGDISSQRTCRNQLGMADGAIEDFQVTSSPWQSRYPPSAGRPFYGGWCASHHDVNPYFQVRRYLESVHNIILN